MKWLSKWLMVLRLRLGLGLGFGLETIVLLDRESEEEMIGGLRNLLLVLRVARESKNNAICY